MLVRIVIILITFILCGTIGSAHNIDNKTYEQWVNYVNCYYVKAYCDRKRKQNNEEGKQILELYTKEIKENLKKVVDDIDGVGKIKTGNFGKLKQQEKCEMLIDFIGGKKSRFDSKWDRDQIIDELINLPTDKPGPGNKSFDFYLEKEKGLLKEKIEKEFPEQYNEEVQAGETIKTQVVEPSGKKNLPERGSETEKSSKLMEIPWFRILLIAVIGVITWGIVWKRKWLKKVLLSNVKSKSLHEKSYKELKAEIVNMQNRMEKIEKQYKKLSQKLEFGKEHKKQEYNSQNVIITTSEEKVEKIVIDKPEPQRFPSVLYSDAIIDGYFNRVIEASNEDTVFELCLRNEQMAAFFIYNNAYKRIIANPSFLEGCDKQILNNAQHIKVENEGLAQRQADGKWKIIKKPNIIIS